MNPKIDAWMATDVKTIREDAPPLRIKIIALRAELDAEIAKADSTEGGWRDLANAKARIGVIASTLSELHRDAAAAHERTAERWAKSGDPCTSQT